MDKYRAIRADWYNDPELKRQFNEEMVGVVLLAARAPAAEFRILGGGLMRTRSEEKVKDRPFVVVEVASGKHRAFYMSTGTGGQTDAGEWNLFGGVADKQLRVSLGWFIKPREGKRVEKYARVSQYLTDALGSTVERAYTNIQKVVPPRDFVTIVEHDTSSEETRRFGVEVNQYLFSKGAIAGFSTQEQEKRALLFEEEGSEEIPHPMRNYPTVYAARRVAFNPRT